MVPQSKLTGQLYDRIGVGYARRRTPDPRIASRIHALLGEAAIVANVGAGSGSYEPANRTVIAIEPSLQMIQQRGGENDRVVQAVAENIPLRNISVDAAMGILTIHHWSDWKQGVRELKRVSSHRIVMLTWDPDHPAFWLTDRYFPHIVEKDRKIFPSLAAIAAELGGANVFELPIPHDCMDGFLGAYWRRPELYLDPEARAAISAFANLPGLDDGLTRLAADLQDGTWTSIYGHLLSREELDVGYRLMAAYT